MHAKSSPAELLASLNERERRAFLASLSPSAAEYALHHWPFWARPQQLPPRTRWRVWLLLAGRGGGKTRTGSETARAVAGDAEYQRAVFGEHLYPPGSRIALVGPTSASVRDVMVEGESGILSCSPPGQRPFYEPSKRRLTWPNGTTATCYSAEEPDRFRGPQHHFVWADELAAWRNPEAWDQLMFGLRLGNDPRAIVTTTPRPTRIIRELMADPNTHVSRWKTQDNAKNLAEPFLRELMKKYKGTTLGRQELDAEVLAEMPGALWQRLLFDREGARVEKAPEMRRIVVGVDPSATAKEGSDEAGIVVAGLGDNGDYYVLRDLSAVLKPDAWARRAVGAYHDLKCDRVIAEVNNGGDMVETVVRTVDTNVAYSAVHASRGKRARAEPIAALYEQGRVHHVGVFPDLEDQCCTYVPGVDAESPDRLDALVWAITSLVESTPIDAAPDIDANMKSEYDEDEDN